MSDHAHHGPPRAEPVTYAAWATTTFWLGLIGLMCVLIYRFAPVGFLLGLLALPSFLFALVQGRTRELSVRIAIPGLVCALVAIAIWLIARDDWPHVMGGDDTWPSWIMGHSS